LNYFHSCKNWKNECQNILFSMQNTVDWNHCKNVGPNSLPYSRFISIQSSQKRGKCRTLRTSPNIWPRVIHAHYPISKARYSSSEWKISGHKNQKKHTKKRCKCNILHSLKVTRYLVGDIMVDKWHKRRPVFSPQ
jgi:hypothetical protein